MDSFGFFLTCLLWIIPIQSLEAVGAWRDQTQQVLKGQQPHRVAIIGAGSAGSSAAYYLNKFSSDANTPTDITVFERSSYIGGRSTTVNVFSNPLEPVEVGGSVFVEVNKNLVNAAKEFGLETNRLQDSRPTQQDGAAAERLGIWNGEEFIFTQSDSSPSWWNTAKLLWKYGMAPVRTQRLMKSTVGTFLKMYEAPHFPFRSLSRVALDLGLTAITGSTGEQYLDENGIAPPFSTDIIQASTRVNYAQNLPLIHGLETMVCMATDGAKAVKGGNWQIFAGMIDSSGADVRLNTSVTDIYPKPDGTFEIASQGGDQSTTTSSVPPGILADPSTSETFDTVILAAPLQYSKIDISPPPAHIPDAIPYVTLHVTLFTSPYRLNPSFFNLSTTAKVPNVVLTTLAPDDHPGSSRQGVGSPGFFSISTLRTVTNPSSPRPRREEYLYKIFSPEAMQAKYIHSLLDNIPSTDSTDAENDADTPDPITWIHHHRWHSYPYLYPRVTFDDPELTPASGRGGGLWYTSGIESFIATMETSSLMGMNVARLVVDGWTGVMGREREGDNEEKESGETA
ncbi:MAG: hypothetical protein M1837_005218 [Sclerophora amabilis]|nr:MAG: hypothetical protein M1837_005218 [Sclerophora amabilis]